MCILSDIRHEHVRQMKGYSLGTHVQKTPVSLKYIFFGARIHRKYNF